MKTLMINLVILLLFATGARADSELNSVTSADRSFFEQIKRAVMTNDVEWLSGSIRYPLKVNFKSGSLMLENKEDFKKHSAAVLTGHLRSAVQNQSFDSLFKNWQGVMVGHGVIWFEQTKGKNDKDFVYRIVGMNPEGATGKVKEASDNSIVTAGEGHSAPNPLPPENVYIVTNGDTANAICRKNQISIEQLLTNNPGLNVESLRVGQRVRIPK
jgi:hypothetical protein